MERYDDDDWKRWVQTRIEREKELEFKRGLNAIYGTVSLILLIVAAVCAFARYWI
jgi:hypothetical protein